MTPDEIVKALRCEHGHLTNHGRAFMLNYTREEFFKILNESADLIESLQARIAELEAQLAEIHRRERTAVEKAISWGADLIKCDTDAHSTFCAECGFPIADYGADREIFCRMCGAKNTSHSYVVTGPGSCRTTVERKAKVYDRLFGTGRGPQEAGKGDSDG